MTQQHVFQEQGHRTWTILRLFYTSLAEFRRQFRRYDERVIGFAKAAGIDREDLRLPADDLAGLLDFKKLEDLRDGYIHELKDLCHEVFRSKDRTDLLDRYVSDIFHEISILKEEHYTVKTYVPMYERDKAEEAKYILDDAHQVFPRTLTYIQHLFERALDRLESLLRTFSWKPIVVRSLYLHRGGFVRDAYPDGLDHFYRLMYRWGPLEGYYDVGTSFYEAGFFSQALEAFQAAESAVGEARERLALEGVETRSGDQKDRRERGHGRPDTPGSTGTGGPNGERAGRPSWPRPDAPEVERARGIIATVHARIQRLREWKVSVPEEPVAGRSTGPGPARAAADASGAGRAG